MRVVPLFVVLVLGCCACARGVSSNPPTGGIAEPTQQPMGTVPPAEAVAGQPFVRGPVETITHHATASSLLVRGGPGSQEPCGIAATVDARTRYLQRDTSGLLRRLDRSTISAGDTVEVYVDGPVADSCPVQGYGAILVRVARL